jgi:hypothetical protein
MNRNHIARIILIYNSYGHIAPSPKDSHIIIIDLFVSKKRALDEDFEDLVMQVTKDTIYKISTAEDRYQGIMIGLMEL